MIKQECPVCHGREVNENGYCTDCGFDVRKYSTLSEIERGSMIYKHAHPEGVVESRRVENGEESSLLHAGRPVRKCSACGEVYLDAYFECPKCHAPNPSNKNADDCGDSVDDQESNPIESDVVQALERTNEFLSRIHTKIDEKKKMSWFSVCSAVFVALLLFGVMEGCFHLIKDCLTPSPAYRY